MNKTRALLIPYAKQGNKIVHVDQVSSGLNAGCTCPECNRRVVARKGNIKIHHFAHYHKHDSCSSETVLHRLGKHFLYERLINALQQNESISLQWKTEECSKLHEGNLLKNVSSALLEKQIQGIRPDITLIDVNNQPVVFVEIVVTHNPEMAVIDYAKDNKIPLIVIQLKSYDQLESIKKDTIKPYNKLSVCSCKKCRTCNKVMENRVVNLYKVPCWRCNSINNVATVEYYDLCSIRGPRFLKNDERLYAIGCGANIHRAYSKTIKDFYVGNICNSCKALQGDWFNYTYPGVYPANTILSGLSCYHCENPTSS